MSKELSRLERKIEVKDFKLNALLSLTQAINNSLPVVDLFSLYKKMLRDELMIEKLALYNQNEEWECILKYGVDGDLPKVSNAEFFDLSSGVCFEKEDGSKENFEIVIPIQNESEGDSSAFLLIGDVTEERRGISPVIKHMKFTQTFTSIMLVAIQNRSLMEDHIRQERMKKELELAGEMQSILVPNSLPKNEYFDVDGMYLPHQQVGGDYYDFLELDEDKVLLCMADVSGKGVSAAFLMANFQAHLRSICKYETINLEDLIHELNTRVMRSAMGEKYITLFIAVYSRSRKSLSYVNCGHNPPVLVASNGESELLKLGCIGLGMFEEIPTISKGQIDIDSGTVLVCYTDGLVEVENDKLEDYGIERIEEVIIANSSKSMQEVNEIIIKAIEEFKGEMPYVDDTAILSCCFK